MKCWECRYNNLVAGVPHRCMKGWVTPAWHPYSEGFVRETRGHVVQKEYRAAMLDGRLSTECPDFEKAAISISGTIVVGGTIAVGGQEGEDGRAKR